ncbi:MAG: carboxypeptidase-like regulatory domain-containing protein [Arenicellales bacterium]
MKLFSIKYSLISVLIASMVFLTACGSSDSSSGGGGSGSGLASISGNVNNGLAFNRSVEAHAGLLAAIYKLVIPVANAAGVPDVLVTLTYPDGTTETTTTDADGNFAFMGLDPGDYSIQVAAGAPQPIGLTEGVNADLTFNEQGSLVTTRVNASEDTISGNVDDGVISDDNISAAKVTVCHKPGTPAEKTLTIAAPAVNAHLNHGDSVGDCMVSVAGDDDGGEEESGVDDSSDIDPLS